METRRTSFWVAHIRGSAEYRSGCVSLWLGWFVSAYAGWVGGSGGCNSCEGVKWLMLN